MALNKQNINLNFSSGLETKVDDKQVPFGKFLTLENSIFTKAGLLQKRNGFPELATLPSSNSSLLTTFNGNLTAVGTNLYAYNQSNSAWVTKGSFQPLDISTLPVVRSNTNQSQVDSVITDTGLICVVYTDEVPVSGTLTPMYKYCVLDSTTGQVLMPPARIPVSSGTVSGSPRVFLLGRYFIIVFTNVITATNHLQYIAINTNTLTITQSNTDITSQYTPSSTVAFDGYVTNNTLFLAWNGSDASGAIRLRSLTSQLALSTTKIFSGFTATIMSVTADTSTSIPVIYASFYDSVSQNGYTLAVSPILVTVLNPTQIISGLDVLNITSTADNMILTAIYELSNTYGYDSGIITNNIYFINCTQAGVVDGSPTLIIRSLGLASKAFTWDGVNYFLGVYDSLYQPSYFLCDMSGNIAAKLAYSNGSGYYTLGLPSVTAINNVAKICYFFKDRIEAINKDQNATSAAGVYAQLGINLVNFNFTPDSIVTSEIGGNLHISGGLLWAYDGNELVEQGFNLWPDYVEATTSGSGGSITAQQYFYQAIYEWTDNQGNIHRSAPSIPISITTTGSTSTNTINIPTLRLTYKVNNPVKIVIYRWSTAQQVYYQVTSIANPLLNSTSVDYVTFTDKQADSSILGNSIIYTTGGVVEDIGPPASTTMSLFKSRLIMLDSENRNLLWYSKQVIENTPVEMSDLFTIFVAPTTSAQGSTGPITALSALDDKLIAFKRDALYYITGTGPDNTGANNDFSDPIFITATVGCNNQQSIVFMPQGLMFQSDKGIWLLDRNLGTSYIGAPVESFTQNSLVQSAVNVPGTNQVRFTLDSGVTLMYDYYYNQWGSFTGIPAVSSTLYQNSHTYLNSLGKVFQEKPGTYLDGANAVLMSFSTSWINMTGVQGFERAYEFYLIGKYISPHKLKLSIAYDYNYSPSQVNVVSPTNFTPAWGGDASWGSSSPWGGTTNLEQWRVFLQQQKCQAFQISMNEIYDSTLGVSAGAGLTLSGLDITIGTKQGRPKLSAAQQVG